MTGIVRLASIYQRRHVFALSVVFACSLPTITRAEVHIEGSPSAVRITTSRDTISDVLSALAATFKVRYRTAIPLSAPADATYSGSFRQVISHLLDGYNYVIKTDDSKTVEIVVLSERGEAVNSPKAPTDKPQVLRVQPSTDESAEAVGLCISRGKGRVSRDPSTRRIISRTYTCTGDFARNLKLVLNRETRERLEGLGHRYAPGGKRAKTIEYECPETDRCIVTVKY
jgi:hypothetical protein